MELKDDGVRREYGTGAVRDTAEGKGRCDLLPLDIINRFYVYTPVEERLLHYIACYIRTGSHVALYGALKEFAHMAYNDCFETMFLEVSKQYEDGAKKYSDRNWEKGIPVHCYIDSAVRHYLKYLRGDDDEPHDRAFVWNILGAIWTHENKPEMIDLPFIAKEKEGA